MSVITSEKDISVEPDAINAWAKGRRIFVELTDGRIISFIPPIGSDW